MIAFAVAFIEQRSRLTPGQLFDGEGDVSMITTGAGLYRHPRWEGVFADFPQQVVDVGSSLKSTRLSKGKSAIEALS
jgi:hypothetical protein